MCCLVWAQGDFAKGIYGIISPNLIISCLDISEVTPHPNVLTLRGGSHEVDMR